MSLMALLLLMIVGVGTTSGTGYSYNLTVTVANGQNVMLHDDGMSSYYYLLNQNLFINNSMQTVFLTSVKMNGASAEWLEFSDADGNLIIQVVANHTLNPQQNATLEMLFEIYLRKPILNFTSVGNISEVPAALLSEYPLKGIWNFSQAANSTQLVLAANSIKGDDDNVLAVLMNLLVWFEDNMAYAYGNSDPQTVWQTYIAKSGDCDDQANLFVLFCRILGIPAYTSLGPIYIPGYEQQVESNLIFELSNVGWHGWAMVYLPTQDGGFWVPVDLTYAGSSPDSEGHIRTSDPMQHILNSALLFKDTAIYMNLKTYDYVSESIGIKQNITHSDALWIEEHKMAPIHGTQMPSVNYYLLSLFVGIFLISVIIFSAWRRYKRS
jgi:hypothetical protein